MDALTPHEKNADQAAYWNGPGGQHWTDRQEMQDAVLAPVSAALIARAAIASGERIIDIGCGCGATTLALAARIGASGHALGLDISAPMLARAHERTPPGAPVRWIAADATVYPFEPGERRSVILAVRRDVLRRSCPFLRQYAHRIASGRPRSLSPAGASRGKTPG